MGQPLWNSLAVPQRLKHSNGLPYYPAMQLVGVYPRKMKTDAHTQSRTDVHNSIVQTSQQWKQLKCRSADEQVIYSHMEHYLAIIANEGLIHAATWMNLKEASYKGSHVDDST